MQRQLARQYRIRGGVADERGELGAYYSRASRTDLAREFIKQPFVRIPTLGTGDFCERSLWKFHGPLRFRVFFKRYRMELRWGPVEVIADGESNGQTRWNFRGEYLMHVASYKHLSPGIIILDIHSAVF